MPGPPGRWRRSPKDREHHAALLRRRLPSASAVWRHHGEQSGVHRRAGAAIGRHRRRCDSISAASARAGAFDGGNGETEDAAAVAESGARRWPGRRLMLAGFSFGAYVALRLGRSERGPRYARLITIAPPVGTFDFSALRAPAARGSWCRAMRTRWWIPRRARLGRAARSSPRLVVMPGVGHFFHGHLKELREAVVDALRSG